MKRFSASVLFIIALLGCYVAFDAVFTRSEWRRFYIDFTGRRADALGTEARFAQDFVKVYPDMVDLQRILESRQKTGAFDYWAIYFGNTPYRSSLTPEEIRQSNFNFFEAGAVIREGRSVYLTEDLGKGFQVVVGLVFDPDAYAIRQFNVIRAFKIKFLLGLSIIALGLFIFFFRDIMRSVQALATPGQRGLRGLRARSREADVLARGLAAYDNQATKLNEELDQLSWQVLPSLRKELQSGRKPPYEFQCTLVRTDINNFSKIFNEHPVEEFAATINDFFTDVTHIVARYGGLIHEFVGDEVIYYFKEDDVGDSTGIALAAIRDINNAAAKYHKLTMRERAYPFTVKSSLAHGRMRFGRFVNGYNLAGAVLIETVRILSNVVEKSGNVIVFDDRHAEGVEKYVELSAYGRVQLKGFTSDVNLVSYLKHKPLREILAEGKQLDLLTYYRSDSDLCETLEWLRDRSLNGDLVSANKVAGLLRRFSVTQTDGRPRAALERLIEDLLSERVILEKRFPDTKLRLLATAVRTIENLVPKAEFNSALESLLHRAAELSDRRVIANALDVLAHYKAGADPEFAQKLLQYDDNRIAANAIVLEGMRDISSSVVRRLQKLVDSGEPLKIASGLYAVGELSRHHQERDPVYYSTQVKFIDIVQRLPEFVANTDAMVRRQALIAARKAADHELLRQIHEFARTSEPLAAEVREHLGESDPVAKAA